MRKIFTLLLVLAIFLCSNSAFPQGSGNEPANRVIAYYFHTNFRCANCYNMEKWTKEALDEYFKDDEKNGTLNLQVVNLDVKGNEHFAAEYQLFTKSVVLSLIKDGKEAKSANLTKVWDYLGDGKKFKAYIKDEVSKYLKEL
ncbi:MAG: nitrophenyl compound nitroreductase subunit ArsF family protein [Candidatus Omnitrophica bacterium]|nr:nitrophenyl compound nitroreductase subunit ArsF family protein [Candidatus Omnitrophota bacterium]